METTGLYEKIPGIKKDRTWRFLPPDMNFETDNGVQYNLREINDLIQEKKEFMAERKKELKVLIPEYKPTHVFTRKKRAIRIRRPRLQAKRGNIKGKKEKEKEKEGAKAAGDKGKAKGGKAAGGKAAGGAGGKK